MGETGSSTGISRFDAVGELRRLLAAFDSLSAGARSRAKLELGWRLAETIGRERGSFSPAYLENVIAGRQDPGAPLVRALRALWISANGGSPIVGAFEPIEVRSRGDVEPGALFLGHSSRCLNCGVSFVGRENQRTCSKTCKGEHDRKMHKERRSNQ